MQHDHRVKHKIHDASLEEVSNVQNYYNEKCTYNVNTHCNLLYPIKIWNCLNFIRKGRHFFFA